MFVKQETNWIALIPHTAVIAILCGICYPIDHRRFFVPAFLIYLLLVWTARKLCFPKALHKSLTMIREKKFEEAIPYIQQAIAFYNNNGWIDKYRFLLLISSSKISNLAMIKGNLGYCYLMIGETNKARVIYENVLRENPGYKNAEKMLLAIKQIEIDSKI